MKKTVLLVCVGNSGRSQMAEAFFQQTSKGWSAASAGIEPDESVHQWTVELMKEIGLDISQRKPKLLNSVMLKEADRIVVMDSDVLKRIPSQFLSKTENWNIDQLRGKGKEGIRRIRDEIKNKVEQLLREIKIS
jgi:arsenate reductase